MDTLGLLLKVVVHTADIQDRDGAKLVFKRMRSHFKKLKLIWADGGYAGKPISFVKRYYRCELVIVKRSDDMKGFKVLPKRWIVERTFSWFNKYRRLAKDYEYCTDTSETMPYLAMIHIMVRRLGKT